MIRHSQAYRIFWALLLSFLAGGLTAQAPSVRFERMEVEKGFPNSVVTTLFQDSRGFLWVGGYAGLLRYDGYEVLPYYFDPGDSLTIGDNKITRIIEDRRGNLWVGTQNGLNYFDRETETFQRFFSTPDSLHGLNNIYILDLLEDETGRLWVGTAQEAVLFDPAEGVVVIRLDLSGVPLGANKFLLAQEGAVWIINDRGLWRTDRQGASPRQVAVAGLGAGFRSFLAIREDASGVLWLGTNDGLFRYRPEEGTADRIPLSEEAGMPVSSIVTASDGSVWCGTTRGVFRYHPATGVLEHFQHDPDDAYSLSSNFVSALSEDRAGNIWIGSSGGVSLFRPATETFRRFPDSYQSQVGVAAFRSFLEYSPGRLLMWEKERGLVLFDWRTGTRAPFPHRPVRDLDAWNTGVFCFFRDGRGRIWMGTHGGVFVYNPRDHSYQRYHQGSGDAMALSDNAIRDICQDSTGAIWVATWNGGVNRILEDQQKVKAYRAGARDYSNGARRVFVDRSGGVWAGTRGGLLRYKSERDTFISYRYDPGDPNSMSENTAFDIYEDEEGMLWIGTYGGGLNQYDPQRDTFIHYTTRNGLPDHTVFSILPDGHGNLWLSTYKGIVKFDPGEETFKSFDYRDGLLNKQYDAFSHYRIPSTGELIYECKQGIDVFHPDSIRPEPAPPPVIFTDFLLFNESVPIGGYRTESGEEGYYLPRAITETRELVLPYRYKTVTFRFASPYFSNPEKVRYSYRLEGFDREWRDIGDQRDLTFTNLPPGRYRLAVRAANADGLLSEEGAALDLIVTPPWWRTWWAFGFYLLVAALLLFAYLRYQRRRLQLRADLAFQQREARRLAELDTVKNQLYTNITHEFRTPLTVILGLTDEIPGYHQAQQTGRLQQAVELVRRNSRKLLQLINQMLDLAKLEAGKITLHPQQGDVVAFLKYLTESYESLAVSKSIDLTFTADPPELTMDYDEEKLPQIFTNLLANALKFTPEGGRVDVRISEAETENGRALRLEVQDNGPGIPADKLPHIFDRFYQVDASSSRPGEGTGIGLTLTKELVELHGGRIEVDSEEGRGARFTVYLPVTNEAPPREEGAFDAGRPVIPLPAEAGATHGPAPPVLADDTLPTLLIVEDAPDIITYLESCLQGRYDIRTAANGRLGLEAALETVPDIILSDVMMPEMDGFELCETLKTDERTSHIPVVLLTARATVQDRLAGLQRGADAYLPKPFHKEELLIRLEKLVKLRRKLQERYAGLTAPPVTDDPALRQEDEFVQKVRAAVEARLDDETFGPNELAAAVHLSRTQVHRKLKALTGRSTGRFIRAIRLQRAMELLQGGADSVQVVAYAVGFSDPAYFTRVFGEEFGGPPRGFVNR